MRLFLSSYRTGLHSEALLQLLGDVKKVAVITNAKDYKPPDERKIKVDELLDFFRSINVEPTEIDLRSLFGKAKADGQLSSCDFIWLAGGNVFLLRRALRYTKLDTLIVDQVKMGSLIYGGESAGAIIAGPTLNYSEMEGHEDSPDFLAEGYKSEVIWEGLGLVDYVPVPHFQDPDYGSEIDGYTDRLEQAKIPHKDMTNDQAIVVNGDKEEFLK